LRVEPALPQVPGVWYEFALADAGAGEALVQELAGTPSAWQQAAVVSPGRVQALYLGAEGEELALALRALVAQHLVTEVARRRVSLEQTVIDLMNGHE
jgi:hypothetical protein